MAVLGLQMIEQEKDLKAGVICFLIVVLKSMYEAVAGDVLFSFLHFGMCGIPLAVCHAGGVLGGIIAYCLVSFGRKENMVLKEEHVP